MINEETVVYSANNVHTKSLRKARVHATLRSFQVLAKQARFNYHYNLVCMLEISKLKHAGSKFQITITHLTEKHTISQIMEAWASTEWLQAIRYGTHLLMLHILNFSLRRSNLFNYLLI